MEAAFAIAVAQFAPGDDTDANLAAIRDLATEAVGRGARLVVLPEYSSFFIPAFDERLAAAAQPLDGPFVAELCALAKVLGVHLVAGMVESASGQQRVYNTLVAVGPEGRLLARYRKVHLYDAFGQRESDWIVPGEVEHPQTFEVGALTVGLQTCYDPRFPEVTRTLVDAGADLVLLPSEWVRGPLKERHWHTLLAARAIENTIYMAAADHAPPVGIGNSVILDPAGVALTTIGEAVQDVALAWISRTRIDQVRAVNPALRLRRYGVHPL